MRVLQLPEYPSCNEPPVRSISGLEVIVVMCTGYRMTDNAGDRCYGDILPPDRYDSDVWRKTGGVR